MNLLTELIENEEWHNALAWVNKIPFDSIETDEYRGTYLWAKARCLDFLGEHSHNIELMYLQSIKLHRNNPDPFPLIRSLVSLSSYYCYQGKAKRAQPLLNESLKLVTKYDISGNIHISVLYAFGIMYGRLHQHHIALQYFNDIERLVKQSKSFSTNGSYQMAIGYSLIHTNQFQNAESYYLQAHSIFTASNDLPRIGICCTNLGIVYRELNRFYLAHSHFQQAIEIFQAHDIQEQLDKVKIEQSLLLMRMNKSDEAKTSLSDVLSYAQGTLRAEALFLLSQILVKENEIDESMITLEQALTYFLDTNHRWQEDAIHFRDEIHSLYF
ncbi:tetratricopeptide repeat protein [Brevibacillus reuszeri]|uniref:tetratricopeptide repeat protein n=1 Tax=Brevibacillus reuszeri TaxID=54915 RepID=UPI0013DEC433|nr:tetratricopeptide repeat protein [Brevibacillus reuszeri]